MHRICLFHDALIPPKKYGGTERIIYWLCHALSQKGHKISLIAKKGSQVPGTEIIELSKDFNPDHWEDLVPKDTEIVHLWTTPSKIPKLPYLVTIEGNGKPGETFLPNTVFISKKHAENHSASTFVYNGLDPKSYIHTRPKEPIAVFLAKASWEVKNLKGAIQIARAAKVPLHVLGNRDLPFDFQRILPPWKGVYYHGMADDLEKQEWLSRARVLLFPVRWHEPFGIAVTEALASGCAVLGTPYGSLPEIVTPEVGFLSHHAHALTEELKRLMTNPHLYPPQKCRERIFQGFDSSQMAHEYVLQYQNVIKTGQLRGIEQIPSQPSWKKSELGYNSKTLLPFSY